MRIFHQIEALARSLFRSTRIDADLAEEMRFHIERETEAGIARGMSPAAARRAAQMQFGSVDSTQERARDDRPGNAFRQTMTDVRAGARLLARSPVFGVTSILIIALGIGAATSVFSVVYGVMLRPLPYHEPDRLVSVWLTRNGERNLPAAADAVDLRALRRVYEDIAYFSDESLTLLGVGNPERLQGAEVSSNLFTTLGVTAAIGRAFNAADEQAGDQRIVVLSDALWRTRFGGDRSVIGRSISLNGAPHTVIGVMPPEFQYPTGAHQAWVPVALEPGELTREVNDNYRIVARLAPGATLEQARTETSTLAGRIAATQETALRAGMVVDGMQADAVRDVRSTLMLLLGAVAFLLLIACANLSNLFAARATSRQGEFAMRAALGASRQRLVAQAAAEAVPVLAAGGVLGVALAAWSVRLFLASQPAGLPRVESIELNGAVLAFSCGLLVLTGIAMSVMPALQAWRSDFTTVMKDNSRNATQSGRRARGRQLAVAAQVAFALPLLTGAMLLLRSTMNVAGIDVGFTPANVLTMKLEVSPDGGRTDESISAYYASLVEAVRAVPGVTHAALINRIPLSGDQSNLVVFERGDGSPATPTSVNTRTVTPEYFETMGIRLIEGRTLTDDDDADAPPVVVVDERIARAEWPGESAIGKRVRGPDWQGETLATVVGVVAHVRATGLEVDPLSQVYWSHRQWTQYRMALAVRTGIDPSALVAPVTTAVRSVDPDQSLYDVRTMDQIIDRSQAKRRLTTLLVLAFACASLLLSAVGIYGVIAFGVARRTREFGIRIAVGAKPVEVLQMVVWQGASTALIGSAVGLVLAYAAAGGMRSIVYGVAPRDALSMLGATAVLFLVAVTASYLPARRAANVDPGMTLRPE